MELPQITIPKAIIDMIPMDSIGAIMHPPLVHFAIVLPIIIVILEISNLILKRGVTDERPIRGKGVSVISMILMLVMVIIFVMAFATGSVDGKAAWDTLGSDGQAELKAHKLLGTYLVYGSILLLILKLISLAGTKARLVLLVVSIIFVAMTLKQGKDGGELVYEYGANVTKVQELDDELFEANDELDSCKSDLEKRSEAPKVQEESVAPKEPIKATPIKVEEAPVATQAAPQGSEAQTAKTSESEDASPAKIQEKSEVVAPLKTEESVASKDTPSEDPAPTQE